MKLISMTDFVLLEENYGSFRKCFEYANFLKQHLTLGLFIPCDDDGNFLEQPIDTIGGVEMYAKRYEEVQSKVLFRGFEVIKQSTYSVQIESDKNIIFFTDLKNVVFNKTVVKTIEDLIPYNLDLAVSF